MHLKLVLDCICSLAWVFLRKQMSYRRTRKVVGDGMEFYVLWVRGSVEQGREASVCQERVVERVSHDLLLGGPCQGRRSRVRAGCTE